MGLQMSADCNKPDCVTGLTPKEKKLVQSTFGVIRKNLSKFAMDLFLLFFKKFPEEQQYFPFKDVPYEKLHNERKLKSHATTVLYNLASLVDNLDNNELLIELLQKLAEKHFRRNISEDSYKNLKIALLELLSNQLGSNFSKEGKEAWEKTLNVAFKVVVEESEKLKEAQ